MAYQNVVDFLLGTDGMMPHGYCFLWNTSLLWLFVISNAVTALSYFSIPLALGFFAYKRKDINFKWILPLFSLFIFACGLTHVLSVVTIWNPVYGLSAIAEAFTAIISLITAILLWPLIPKALRIPAPSSLLLANKKLEDEILYHKETKAQLKKLNNELDELVALKIRELQASESHLRLSQMSGGIGTWETNLVNNKQIWSENCISMLGLPNLSEPTWDEFLAAIHSEDRQRVINATQNHIEFDEKYDVEYRVITADGSIRWMRSAGQVERDAAGKLSVMRGIVQDITERNKTEKKNQQFGNILEQSLNEIYIFNSESLYFEHVNQGAINNLGFSFNELKKMTPFDIKLDCDSESFIHLLSPLIDGKQDQLTYEAIHQRKNGSCYPVEVSLQIYRNNPDYLVAICLDISQRKAMERNLIDERNLLYSLINNSPDYIFCKNTVGEYLICNESVTRFFKQPIESIIGHTDFDFVDPETARLFRADDAAVLAKGSTCVNEDCITLSEDTKIILETLKTPLKDSEGNVLGIIGIGRDITQRKAHEVKISRLSAFYSSLSKINHAIVQINNERDLFSTVCTKYL